MEAIAVVFVGILQNAAEQKFNKMKQVQGKRRTSEKAVVFN